MPRGAPSPCAHRSSTETQLPLEIRRGHHDDEILRYEEGRVVCGYWMPTETTRITTRGTYHIYTDEIEPLDDEPDFSHPSVPRPVALSAAALDPNHAALATVWNTIAHGHYDPSLNGVDWDAHVEAFRTEYSEHQDEQLWADRVNVLLHPLEVSHLFVIPPNRAATAGSAARPGTIGFELRVIEDHITVFRTRAGGVAEGAGISPGWVLQRIRGLDEPGWRATAPQRPPSTRPDTHRLNIVARALFTPTSDPITLSFLDPADRESR